jgi:hypothetical protein
MHYDTTPALVTAWCDCGWRDISSTTTGARSLAAEHQHQVHPRSAEGDLVRSIRAARDEATRRE